MYTLYTLKHLHYYLHQSMYTLSTPKHVHYYLHQNMYTITYTKACTLYTKTCTLYLHQNMYNLHQSMYIIVYTKTFTLLSTLKHVHINLNYYLCEQERILWIDDAQRISKCHFKREKRNHKISDNKTSILLYRKHIKLVHWHYVISYCL